MKRLLQVVFVSSLAAQQQTPHAGYVYPAGGRQGASIELRVGGQFLNGASKVYVAGSGVEARVTRYQTPPTGAEAQKLRDEMQQLNQKRTASSLSPAELERAAELRDKLEEVQRRPSIPAIAEIVILQVTIAADAPAGPRQLRLETTRGLTNPITFVVGDLPEFTRPPARVGTAYNVVNGGTPVNRQVARPPDPPTEISLPAVLNGQMMPATSDQYRFHASKGQHLVIAAAARELIPYLSDTVPGWFQAALALRDSQGRELASADHFLFHPDPLLEYEIASDGDYIAAIHDSIYRGREDFIYRIAIGELPVLGSIFPLGGRAGKRASIETHGWNLAAARIVKSVPAQATGLHPAPQILAEGLRGALVGGHQAEMSSTLSFAVDTLPEVMARQAIGRRENAQRVKLPVIANGRIAQPGAPAFFRFEGRAGEEIVAEVQARRLGSPLDSVLRLIDAGGKELAFNDDFDDKGAGLLTHQADSYLSAKLPAKGTYYLELADAERHGGVEYGYRLRIGHPRPDFELRVAPSSLNLRAGATVPIAVHALRRDGFMGPIDLQLKDAPAGFALQGAVIPSAQDEVRVTLTAPRGPLPAPLAIQLTGQAMVDGHQVHRTAVPAEDLEQAFAYHHLVAEDAWMVRVIGVGNAVAWRPVDRPIQLPMGGAARVQLFVPPRLLSDVQLALNEPPEGISIQSVTRAPDGVFVTLRAERDKAKPGLKGNLIVDAFRDVPANPAAGGQQRRRQPLGTLPAIPFELVDAR